MSGFSGNSVSQSASRALLGKVSENYRTPPADIYAVYPQRHQLARRVRVLVDFLCQSFERKSIIQTA